MKRPDGLTCDIHRFTVEKRNWLIFVSFLDSKPFEIFAADFEIDDDDVISIPKSIKTAQIIKVKDAKGNKRYDLIYKDKNNYKVKIEGIGRMFDKNYYNHIIDVSFLLRYAPSVDKVIYIVKKWKELSEKNEQLRNILIETLKKYLS